MSHQGSRRGSPTLRNDFIAYVLPAMYRRQGGWGWEGEAKAGKGGTTSCSLLWHPELHLAEDHCIRICHLQLRDHKKAAQDAPVKVNLS